MTELTDKTRRTICSGNGAPASIIDVLYERGRQVAVEGRSPEHDDEHQDGSIALAAAAYTIHFRHPLGRLWPWADGWKPGDHRRNLVKAGALILAEIDRLDRAAEAAAA